MSNQHTHRETWLTSGAEMLVARFFTENGYEVPKWRISCGFPRGHARAIGQCFDKEVSADETYEMFICPTQADPVEVLQIALHELIHASVGIEAGHKGPFRKLAKEFGMAGKMTATYAEVGSELYHRLEKISNELGPYPHAPMTKKRKPSKPNKWVRYYSANEESYRVVVNIDKVEEHGVPRDPWGDDMLPASEE